MGLGTKIKEALHGDHRDRDHTTSEVKAPGAYPDEPYQRQGDASDETSPRGSIVDQRDTTDPAGTSDFGSAGIGKASAQGPSDNLTGSYGSPHNKLHRDTEDYHPTQEAYSQPTHGHRPQDSGVGLGQQISAKDHASQGGYWGDMGHEGRGDHSLTKDLPGRTTRGHDYTGAGRGDHKPHFADQAVGGGEYNPVSGTSSQDRSGSQGTPYITPHSSGGGAVHDPLTSSTKGTSLSPGHTYDQKVDQPGHGLQASRNDHTGGGLTGAGAAGAAGYGANEYAHQGHGSSGYDSSLESASRGGGYAPGVPRSSMLDPEPGVAGSATHKSRQASGISPMTQPGLGSMSTAASSGATAASGLGKDHYGPAHEGAKVVHTCQHCGQDNDISQYFRKEAVYRLGS